MKQIFLTLTVLFLWSCSPQSEWLSSTQPENVGYSSETIAEIEDYIAAAVEEQVIPGGTFVLAKEGKTILNKSFGRSGDTVSYNNDDIYRIASMTKAITCVAIMQLVGQGQVELDDPVSKYIPSFRDQVVLDQFNPQDSSFTTVPAEKEVTIRNLMTHTSGIVYGSFNPGKLMAVYEQYDMNVGFSHDEWSTEEWIDRLAEVPLAHQPGERFSYGLNMDVLGRIIEVTSGQGLDEYFRQNIFEPVGMNDTYFYLPENKFDRLTPVMLKVQGTYRSSDELGMAAAVNYPLEGPRNLFAGGAGLSSTAMDYTMFIQTLVEGGGEILSTEMLNLMTTDQLPMVINDYERYPKGSDGSFCLGFTLYQDKDSKRSPKSPGTYEWGGYFNTKFFIDPEEQMVFTGMTQISGFNGNGFWDELYGLIYDGVDD
jgi:CubicO group peptidase (beta-lactamase class C family)